MKYVSRFTFCIEISSGPSPIYWKTYPFSIKLPLHLVKNQLIWFLVLSGDVDSLKKKMSLQSYNKKKLGKWKINFSYKHLRWQRGRIHWILERYRGLQSEMCAWGIQRCPKPLCTWDTQPWMPYKLMGRLNYVVVRMCPLKIHMLKLHDQCDTIRRWCL